MPNLELHEKLQELRKSRGLTQEELAEALYVSRTAVSKWESGRGYPSIDSLRELSAFFSVSIDDLLSGEQLILLADQENKSNFSRICDLLTGFTDLFSFLLILLPLYPKPVNGYIYSVNLIHYTDNAVGIIRTYWLLFLALTAIGMVKSLMTCFRFEKGRKLIAVISMGLSVAAVLFLAMAKEPYAVTLVFLLLLVKGVLLYQRIKSGK